jgi:dihydrofolate reductase
MLGRMTRTQYYVASSLDGFIADAEGRLEWLTPTFDRAEGVAAHYEKFIGHVGALAMGARTYEFVLGQGDAWPYAGLPTWVFTHRSLPTIDGADVRFTRDDVSAVHADMVQAAAGKNVWMVGGGHLAAQFAERGLLDELWLTVIPVTLGGGAPLLPASLRTPFALEEVTRFGMGVVELRYRLR